MCSWASLVAQLVKNRPAMQEILVWFLGGLERSPGKGIGYPPQYSWAFLMAQMVKNLPVTQELWVWSLGREDPLEDDMATHSSILAWRTPWTEEADGLQSMGSQRVRRDWATKQMCSKRFSTFTHLILVLTMRRSLWPLPADKTRGTELHSSAQERRRPKLPGPRVPTWGYGGVIGQPSVRASRPKAPRISH